ncbi:hypothetical protein RUND412_008050 [Rhizina undulata]
MAALTAHSLSRLQSAQQQTGLDFVKSFVAEQLAVQQQKRQGTRPLISTVHQLCEGSLVGVSSEQQIADDDDEHQFEEDEIALEKAFPVKNLATMKVTRDSGHRCQGEDHFSDVSGAHTRHYPSHKRRRKSMPSSDSSLISFASRNVAVTQTPLLFNLEKKSVEILGTNERNPEICKDVMHNGEENSHVDGRRMKNFQKRARYKMRDSENQNIIPEKNEKDSVRNGKRKMKNRREKSHPKSKKPSESLIENFSAENVVKERITLRPSHRLGLFKKGRASSPFKKRGLPDLAFSEMDFLYRQKKPDHLPCEKDGAGPGKSYRKEEGFVYRDAVSSYIHTSQRKIPPEQGRNAGDSNQYLGDISCEGRDSSRYSGPQSPAHEHVLHQTPCIYPSEHRRERVYLKTSQAMRPQTTDIVSGPLDYSEERSECSRNGFQERLGNQIDRIGLPVSPKTEARTDAVTKCSENLDSNKINKTPLKTAYVDIGIQCLGDAPIGNEPVDIVTKIEKPQFVETQKEGDLKVTPSTVTPKSQKHGLQMESSSPLTTLLRICAESSDPEFMGQKRRLRHGEKKRETPLPRNPTKRYHLARQGLSFRVPSHVFRENAQSYPGLNGSENESSLNESETQSHFMHMYPHGNDQSLNQIYLSSCDEIDETRHRIGDTLSQRQNSDECLMISGEERIATVDFTNCQYGREEVIADTCGSGNSASMKDTFSRNDICFPLADLRASGSPDFDQCTNLQLFGEDEGEPRENCQSVGDSLELLSDHTETYDLFAAEYMYVDQQTCKDSGCTEIPQTFHGETKLDFGHDRFGSAAERFDSDPYFENRSYGMDLDSVARHEDTFPNVKREIFWRPHRLS